MPKHRNIPRLVPSDNQPDADPKEYNYSYTVIYQQDDRPIFTWEYPAHQLPYVPRIGEEVVLDINMFNDTGENLQTFFVKGVTSVIRMPRKKIVFIRTDIYVDVESNKDDTYLTIE